MLINGLTPFLNSANFLNGATGTGKNSSSVSNPTNPLAAIAAAAAAANAQNYGASNNLMFPLTPNSMGANSPVASQTSIINGYVSQNKLF